MNASAKKQDSWLAKLTRWPACVDLATTPSCKQDNPPAVQERETDILTSLKRILLLLLALPLTLNAQIELTNSSFSNGFGTGTDGVNILTTLLGSTAPLSMAPVMQIVSGVNVIPNNHPSLYNVDYGILNLGSASKFNYEIKNSGSALQINSATISGVNAADFELTIASLPHTVLPVESLVFSITFLPTAEGLRTAKISFNSNDPDDNPYEFSLSGTGSKVDQIITFDFLISKIFGDESFALTATASSALDVSYVSSDNSVATVNGNSITIVGAGETFIKASQPGNATFSAAFEVQQVLIVNKASIHATADNKTKSYGEVPDPSLTINYTGFKGSDDESVLDNPPTASTSVTGTSDAGSYDIIPAGGDDNNYSFIYVEGAYTVDKLSLLAIADDKTKIYGEENPPFTITYTGFELNESASVVDVDPTILTTVTQLSAPGTYPITLEGGSDNNYDFNLVYGTLTITALEKPIKGATDCYLINPTNNDVNVNYYIALTSNKVGSAQLYTIEANTQSDFLGESMVKQSSSQSIKFLLAYNTQYYVRVQTDQAPNEWGATSTFTTGDPVSLAFITSPKDGGAGVPTDVKVTANTLFGATSYTIELNTTADFNGLSFVKTKANRTISFKDLTEATTYYARVSTDLFPGQWGPVTSFSTINPAGRGREDWMGEVDEVLETEGISYNIFPNPFKENVTMLIQSLTQDAIEITLFDLSGKSLESKRSMTNHVVILGEGLGKGIYILKIITAQGWKSVRLVKF